MNRVLFVANASKIGGGNKVFMDLMTNLASDRFSPILISPDIGPITEWADAQGIPCFISAGRDWFSATGLGRRGFELFRLIRRTGATIVHAAAPTAYRALGLAAHVGGVVRICHLGFPPSQGELKRSFMSGPEAVIGCYAGQAAEHADEIRRLKPSCRVVGIPNGVDINRFSPVPAPGEDPNRWRFGARHVVGIVGHLSEVKGYPAFVDAAAEICRTRSDCAFLAVGSETTQVGFERTIKERVSALGLGERVHFAGFQSNVAPLLRAMDVVALPSLAEGFPLAVLEAMACARPVIATPVGGVPEAVVNGETGVLIPPGSPSALAAAILQQLEPSAGRKVGEAARRRVVEQFSVSTFAERVQHLYDELLAQNHSA